MTKNIGVMYHEDVQRKKRIETRKRETTASGWSWCHRYYICISYTVVRRADSIKNIDSSGFQFRKRKKMDGLCTQKKNQNGTTTIHMAVLYFTCYFFYVKIFNIMPFVYLCIYLYMTVLQETFTRRESMQNHAAFPI